MQTARSSRMITASGLSLMLAFGLLTATPAVEAGQSRVTLVATINNRSALLPGKWLIFKATDMHHPISTLPRHSGTVLLPAGKYRARVEVNNKIKETAFRVETDVDKMVTIAVD